MKKQYIGMAVAALLVGSLLIFTSNNSNMDSQSSDKTGASESVTEDAGTKHLASAEVREVVDATDKDNVDVEINDFYFGTTILTIKSGTTVTWTNKGSIRHDVKQANGSPTEFESSKLLNNGESYSYTFDKAGDYFYFCSPHPTQMRAIVKVVD